MKPRIRSFPFEMIQTIGRFLSSWGIAVFLQSVATAQVPPDLDQTNWNEALNQQFQDSLHWVWKNLHHPEVRPGLIIASPSKTTPNYFFHWARDGALTAMALEQILDSPRLTVDQRVALLQYLGTSHLAAEDLQNNARLGSNLGEPKFHVDGEIFRGPWGRPQNDGPALRLLAASRFAERLSREHQPGADALIQRWYSLGWGCSSFIKCDAEYIAHHWRHRNFDLWEESSGIHFYTLSVQRSALIRAAGWALHARDPDAASFYLQQTQAMAEVLSKFWDADRQTLLATLDHVDGSAPSDATARHKTNVDSAVILGALHSNITSGSTLWRWSDSRWLSSIQFLREGFRSEYELNQRNPDLGVAFGRYPFDRYDGVGTNSRGNPWILTTAGLAEFWYRFAKETLDEGVSHWSPASRLLVANSIQKYLGKDKKVRLNLRALVRLLRLEGDAYLARVLFHKNKDGSLSEQIDRDGGYMRGAQNLTWSHASILTAVLARDSLMRSFSDAHQ